MRRTLVVATAVTTLTLVVAASGCTDDGNDDGAAKVSTTVKSRPVGSDAANRLGCTSTRSGGVNVPGTSEPATDCFIDGRFVARLEIVSSQNQVAALRRLSGGAVYTPGPLTHCPDGRPLPAPWVVVTPKLLAVTQTKTSAHLVIARLGGHLAPDRGTIGPIASYYLPCDYR